MSLAEEKSSVASLRQQGWDAFRRGQFTQAEDCLRRAARQAPNDAVLHHNLGVVLANNNQLADALSCFEKAVRLRPDYAAAHHHRGNALRDLGRAADAIPCYEEALRLQPPNAAACYDLGVALLTLQRSGAAIPHLYQAARLRPDHADTHNRLAQALAEANRLAEAAESYRQLTVLQPQRADAHHNLGVLLARLGRHDEAAIAYRQAARLRPKDAEAHNNLGIALVEIGELEESVAAFRTAISLNPDYAEAHINLGITLVKLNDIDGAQVGFAEALRLRPDYPKARTNLAMAWLQMGDYERGWPEYEWRWQTEDFTPRSFRQPRWDGAPLAGRAILLHAEQGLGDTIQFIRYAPLVQERGGVVLVEAPARLLPLLTRCPGIDRLTARGAPLPEFDVEAPLLSLPALFNTTLDTVPAPIPYLSAEPERLAHWRGEVRALSGLKIGIGWRGSPTYRGDRQRSMPVRHFGPLAQVPGVRLVSLQKGPGAEELKDIPTEWNVLDLSPRLDEGGGAFMDTAAVVAQLDLVLCSDTSVAHLAGALGVPVWLALPFAADWRWGLKGETTPWYPKMRLFRQRRAGDWDEVFGRMAEELQAERVPARPAPALIAIHPAELLDRLADREVEAEIADSTINSAAARAEVAALRLARQERLSLHAELLALENELHAAHQAFRCAIADLPEYKRLNTLRCRMNDLLGR
jgi:tetratricopeptide (TPR) repeat protein